MIAIIIDFFLSYLLLYTYTTLFVVSYIAALILPLPSNTTLLASSVFASQGYLTIYNVFLVALSANVLGDLTGFLLSRKYGKKVLMKTPLSKIITSQNYTKVETFFAKNAGIAIFTTRFFGGVGPLINIVSGFSNAVSLRTFLFYGIAGEILYVSFFTFSGYYLGNTWLYFFTPVQIFWVCITGICVSFFCMKIYKMFKHS